MKAHPFPIGYWLLFLAIVATLALVSTVAENHCSFGFGGYQCNGWLTTIQRSLWYLGIGAVFFAAIVLFLAIFKSFMWLCASRKR